MNSTKERLAPCHAVDVGVGQKRPREPAPDPEPRHLRNADLGGLESGELDVLDAPGQRFGALAQQCRTCTAEHEEPRRVVVTVGQHP